MSLLRSSAKLAFTAADLVLPRPKGPRLLIYHQVGTGSGEQMSISTRDFVWQLEWLADNRDVVDLGAALERWTEPGADRLVVLTFDDGYDDLFTTAFPLMRERDVPFTLYVATEMIETGRRGDGTRSLTWDQIAEMLGSGLMTIGAHTHTHRDLRSATFEETVSELEHSNHIIEQRLGVEPRHFAYPWGYWGPSAHEAVASTYETAVLGAPLRSTDHDPHKIHRFPVQLSDGTWWFRSRLRGGLVGEEWVRRRLRDYDGP